MKPFVWREGMSDEEAKNGAYWERNMLANLLACTMNTYYADMWGGPTMKSLSGWYRHQGDGFEGWSRVISIDGGKYTFHVPDDFEIVGLPEIEPNWDGHTTEQKWDRIMKECEDMKSSCDYIVGD